jgi:hypothetical protein
MSNEFEQVDASAEVAGLDENELVDVREIKELIPGDGRWAPPGRYPVQCVDASGGVSKKGNKMITAIFEVRGGEYDGVNSYEYFVLDGNNLKATGFGKGKLKQLGIDLSAEALTFKGICDRLLAQNFLADLDTEEAEDKDGNQKLVTVDGQKVVQMRNRIKAFYTSDPRAAVAAHAQQNTAPAPRQQAVPPFVGQMPAPVQQLTQPAANQQAGLPPWQTQGNNAAPQQPTATPGGQAAPVTRRRK